MKTWNAPVISELKINETANGCIDWEYETWIIGIPVTNDSKKSTPPEEDHS